MIRLASAGLAALAVVVGYAPSYAADAQLAAAVAGAQRAPENKARDGARHPAETLTFFGLKPRQTVIEISPGGGYWTEILAPYAKATGGTYVATAADLANPSLSEGARRGRAAFETKFGDQAKYGAVRYVNFGTQSGPLGAPNSADLVMTSRNIHNFMMQNMLDKVLRDAHAVLKPGGILAVEEHRSDPRPELPGVSNGYVATATVIAAAEKAGFRLASTSEVNANPKDTKDHPFGVWTLPPSRWTTAGGRGSDPNFDRTKYDAIGESDRMTLTFVKGG
ncbi:MAG: class I SAM-dependent methyltransferase [Phenylobacterium sp.]|uniref:class I SAM-dependent methyltransferase n=1 Tax=Phenylobacterium sp. TaxID=1871053 RepID=UPI001A383F7D|nr:methyltransferase domain-containing protein [Phenylobacterium sp.]MBL8555144.1 class I SAM-dependent methyltransferase [Phenylobacterium sp.]